MKNIRQYEIALEIARTGSISKAAEGLRISQSTLSKLLQKLESELGAELFDRSSFPLKPTASGKVYLEAAQKILNIDHQLEKNLSDIKQGSSDISFGISPSRAPFILPGILREYRKSVKDGKILIREGSTGQLNAALNRGETDLMISLLNDSTKMFRCVPLFTETSVLAVPQTMAGMSAEEILLTQPFISLCSGLRLWRFMQLIMEKLSRPVPEIECQSIESGISLVRSGFGAMIVPSYYASAADQAGEGSLSFMRLPESYYRDYANELNRNVCLFYRSDDYLSQTEEIFVEACRRAAGTPDTDTMP